MNSNPVVAHVRRQALIKALFLGLLTLSISCLLVACNGRRARRYRRTRQRFPDSYRIALLHPYNQSKRLSSITKRNLSNNFLKELRRHPVLSVTDPYTVQAYLRKNRLGSFPTGLEPRQIEEIGQALDIEAFLLPEITSPPGAPSAGLKITLYNGYSGRPLWTRESHGADIEKAFASAIESLLSVLSTLADVQTTLKRNPGVKTHGAVTEPPDRPLNSAKCRLATDIGAPEGVNLDPAGSPSYERGAEQVELAVPGFQPLSARPGHRPIKSLRVRYAQGLRATITDLGSPAEAKRYLDDTFGQASPQLLSACRAFALRDKETGRLAVGLLLGKFTLICEGPRGSEKETSALAESLARVNHRLVRFFAQNPAPPSPVVKITRQPTKVIREIRYKVRTQKVEIPRTIVPTIEIRLDGRVLGLVRNSSLSSRDRVVLQLDDKAGPCAKSPPSSLAFPGDGSASLEFSPSPDTETSSAKALLHNNLGRRYLAASRFRQAAHHFIKALELDPSYRAPRTYLRQMNETYGLDVKIPRPGPGKSDKVLQAGKLSESPKRTKSKELLTVAPSPSPVATGKPSTAGCASDNPVTPPSTIGPSLPPSHGKTHDVSAYPLLLIVCFAMALLLLVVIFLSPSGRAPAGR